MNKQYVNKGILTLKQIILFVLLHDYLGKTTALLLELCHNMIQPGEKSVEYYDDVIYFLFLCLLRQF